ncbi:hypothetical protein V1509DRAFT_616886 [Lipomyces kononenkoae]
MSKYWCKPCKTFVLDTKLGQSQHEASVRHKSSMNRTLRDLHRQKTQAERDERDAKRILEGIERSISGLSSNVKTPTATKSHRAEPTVARTVSVAKSSNVSVPAPTTIHKTNVSTSKSAGSSMSRPLGGQINPNRITKPGPMGSSGQLFSNGSKNAIKR